MAAWRSLLPLLFIAALIAVEDMLSSPSCSISIHDAKVADHPDDLKVMMVADLLLRGSDAGLADLFFRNLYTARFFKKSFERLNPDMLIVLGDISARGSKLTEMKWVSVLQQFQVIMGPFASLPYHVVFGDRDIGDCHDLDQKFVREIASNLPGLDSYGSGSFQISNISFVSLNAVALLCGDNNLRFGVEKLIERESIDLQSVMKGSSGEPVETKEETMGFSEFNWRVNNAASGSGPVLLLHFPLHRTERNNFGRNDLREGNLGHNPCGGLKSSRYSRVIDGGPYERIHTLPPNATEYIFQSLKPRMVFSAHTQYFSEHIHSDGTREVTVPGMTWATRGEPGFVMVTFKENNVVLVGHCSLSSESRVLATYIFMFILLLVVATLWARLPYLVSFTL